MSDINQSIIGTENLSRNVFPLNDKSIIPSVPETPATDKMEQEARRLNEVSKYQSTFDWGPIRKLELRDQKRPVRGGFIFKTPLKLVNSHSTCQQCLYAFELDTYGRGCIHNCVYCYAKAQLTQHGMWNSPYPAPINVNDIRKIFYTVFETNKVSKWRTIFEKRVPLRIGSMSDSFMLMDETIKVTQEVLKILKYYNYPYVIFTRSDLVAQDEYLEQFDPKLTAIQFSISSINDKLNRLLEPGAPSSARRLKALEVLVKNKLWTTVRINPLFPIYPDGYYTNPDFQWDGPVPKFEYSSFDIVDAVSDTGTTAILAGFGRFSSYSLNQIERATGFDLKPFFASGKIKSTRDYHFSDEEIRFYYKQIKDRCVRNAMEFTTCYIGNGENHFWKDQDMWSNKIDCCNIKNRVSSFKSDAREIPFEERLKHTSNKCTQPNSEGDLHRPLGRSNNSTLKLSKPNLEISP